MIISGGLNIQPGLTMTAVQPYSASYLIVAGGGRSGSNYSGGGGARGGCGAGASGGSGVVIISVPAFSWRASYSGSNVSTATVGSNIVVIYKSNGTFIA